MPGGEGVPVLRKMTLPGWEELKFQPANQGIRDQALSIINEVNGEDDLLRCAWCSGEIPLHSRKFEFSRDELKQVYESLETEKRGVLQYTAAQIRAVSKVQLAVAKETELAQDDYQLPKILGILKRRRAAFQDDSVFEAAAAWISAVVKMRIGGGRAGQAVVPVGSEAAGFLGADFHCHPPCL